ncbi:MAG: DUF3341 domain-containing protein [Bacteroidetes bacterium]|nr:DUF3341 domain-containing protein [Bacteroidota bacterium]
MDTNSKKLILGIYDDPDHTLDATSKLVHTGFKVFDVYSPFAIHGLDRVMGVKRSKLSLAATGYFDWQINIGGKPFLHIPTYIPITFELGILFTAFGMVSCFFVVNKMFWGKNADIMDIRVTDDRFVVAVEVIEGKTNLDELNKILIANGAIEVRERMKEE